MRLGPENPRVTYVRHYWQCDGQTRLHVTIDGHDTGEQQGNFPREDDFINWLSKCSDTTLDAIVRDLIADEKQQAAYELERDHKRSLDSAQL